ncbi:MAG TPA: hypothetical protein VHA14_06695 [Bryobacteraceae bacterium]|nr:hypothetical protein [Bryobacteraceae bacterium]
MSKPFAIAFGAAVLVIIGLVWGGFIFTKGNHLAPDGFISNVRAQQLSPDMVMIVIDFGIVNDSDVQMVVRRIDPFITTADGKEIHGVPYSASDMEKVPKFYPALGPMIHPDLRLRGTIDPHKTSNFMIGAGFDATPEVVQNRKKLTLEIEDVTGPVLDLTSN